MKKNIRSTFAALSLSLLSSVLVTSSAFAEAKTGKIRTLVEVSCTVTSNGSESKELPLITLDYDDVSNKVQPLTTINGITLGFSNPPSIAAPLVSLHIIKKEYQDVLTRELHEKTSQLAHTMTDDSGNEIVLNCSLEYKRTK